MKQIQLADIVEIKSIMRLNSLRTGNNEEKVSDPFHYIKPQDFNEFGYVRATEATSEVTLSEHDLNYVSARNVVLKPYDILISIRFQPKIPVGIMLDEISLDCIASPVFTILRVENHQQRKELSLNIFSFFVSKIGSQFLNVLGEHENYHNINYGIPHICQLYEDKIVLLILIFQFQQMILSLN